MKASITFSANGYFTQEVEITKEGLTAQQLQEMLNAGKAWTTIDDSGEGKVEIVETGEIIGRVLSVDNNLDYDDFVVEES